MDMADKARIYVKALVVAAIATAALAAAVAVTGGSGILLAVLASLAAIELLVIGRIADRGLSLDCTPNDADAAAIAPFTHTRGVRHAA